MSNFTVELKKLTKGLKKRLAETIQPFDSDDPNEIHYDYAIDLDGVLLSNDGAIGSLTGRTQKITSGITGVVRYQTVYSSNAGVQTRVVYADNGTTGTWYQINYLTGVATSIGTMTGGGLVWAYQTTVAGTTAPVLVMLSTKNIPKKWDGTTYGSLSGIPATYSGLTTNEYQDAATSGMGSYPSLGCSYANRPWLSGDATYPYRVYYGALFDAETWSRSGTPTVSSSGYLDIYPKDGFGPVVCIIPERTINGTERLLVFKERAIYAITGNRPIDTTGVTPYFQVLLLTAKRGTRSRYSVKAQSNDTTFLGSDKVYTSLRATITNAEADDLTLSYDVQPLFDLIPDKALPNTYVEDYIKRQQLWISHYKDYAEYSNDTSTRALYHFDNSSSAVAATGSITFSVNPSATNTITINSIVFTFIAGSSSGTDIHIAANLAATLAEVVAVLNASANASVTPATYSTDNATRLVITHDTAGTGGNAFTLAASVATVSASTLTGGLAAGTATDASSNGYHLTNNNSATNFLGFNNYLDDAYSFNGTNQYLGITTGIGAALTAFTASVWVKIDTLPTGGNKSYILNCNHTAGKFAIYVENVAGTYSVKCSVWDSGNTETKATYTVTPSITTWINIVLAWDGSTITQFYNGASVATASCASILTSGTNGFAIASSSATAFASGIAGKIDEVRIYTTALAIGKVSEFYSGVSQKNNMVQIYDYRIGNWTKATDIISAASLGYVIGDSVLLAGNYDATIDQEDSGATFGLSRRIAIVKFPWIESPNKRRFKVDDFPWWLTQFGTGDYIVRFVWEDGDEYYHTEAIVPPSSSNWDSATFDVSYWGGGGDNAQVQFSCNPIGSGRRLQVILYTYQENLAWIYLGGVLNCTEMVTNK